MLNSLYFVLPFNISIILGLGVHLRFFVFINFILFLFYFFVMLFIFLFFFFFSFCLCVSVFFLVFIFIFLNSTIEHEGNMHCCPYYIIIVFTNFKKRKKLGASWPHWFLVHSNMMNTKGIMPLSDFCSQ